MTDENDIQENISNLLVPLEEYLKAGIHIGTKYQNKSIKSFIYKTKSSGLKILDIKKVNDRLEDAGKFLANYEAKDILIVGRRETGFKAIKKMAELTGVRAITGRYLPGTITNPEFGAFIEPKLLLVTDPWHDKQVIKDAILCNIPILALVGSNNTTENVDLSIPCNNKSRKSLPLIFYILTREYLKNRELIKSNEEFTAKIEDFSDEEI